MGVHPTSKKHNQPFHHVFPVELLKCLPKITNSFAERLKTNSTSEGIAYIVYIIGISEGKKRMCTVFHCKFCIEQKDIILCLTQGWNSPWRKLLRPKLQGLSWEGHILKRRAFLSLIQIKIRYGKGTVSLFKPQKVKVQPSPNYIFTKI